ncbi:MAG TPA: rhomboid family intramembrane serine protease [Bacteroidales bacterium]|nr:rhomboid family intramembrane serine protease [Bacteroidales bacterium]
MDSFWDKLKLKYSEGNIVTRLIFINTGIFLVLRLIMVLLGLFKVETFGFMNYLQMPSSLPQFLITPWTAITYMFVHLDLMHILFNMLWLFFFGGMFLRWFTPRQLGGLYVIGGLSGALFFIVFYNLFPAFEGVNASLMGASASILALGIAVAFYRPDEPVSLFLLGTIKLKWLAIVMIVMDVLSLNGSNAGGSMAHLGGAVAGLLFGLTLRQNIDITHWINPFIDGIANLFRPRPKMKVTYRRSKSEQTYKAPDVDQEYRDRKKAEMARLDTILDKIKKSGYDSLTAQEKQQLFESSKNGQNKS